jgi:membrane protein
MKLIKKYNKFKQKHKFIFSEKFLTITSILLLLEIYLGIQVVNACKDNVYIISILLAGLILTFLTTLIIGISLFIEGIIKTIAETPFTFCCVILALSFILVPIYFTDIKDSVTSFFLVGVGIGVNQVLEGVFKYTETDFSATQKKYVTNLTGFIKIFFNCLYISAYISTYLNQQLGDIRNNYITNDIINNIFFNKGIVRFIAMEVFVFIILMVFALLFSFSLQKEVNSESDSDIEKIKRMLNDKQNMLSNFRDNNEQAYQEICRWIENMEESVKDDIEKCEKFK